jgi:hypothetical protein
MREPGIAHGPAVQKRVAALTQRLRPALQHPKPRPSPRARRRERRETRV